MNILCFLFMVTLGSFYWDSRISVNAKKRVIKTNQPSKSTDRLTNGAEGSDYRSSQSLETSELASKKKRRNIKSQRNTMKKNMKEFDYITDDEDSESAKFESEEIKVRLGKGETFLDFSQLAKIKKLNLDQGRNLSSSDDAVKTLNENPYLNWTCSPLSLEEEANISSGYIDKKIANVIENAEDYPEGGTQLLEDMQLYYCFLKHVNTLVINKIRRGKQLMKILVEEDPHFVQIRFDTEELTDHFSWITEEAVAFEKIMDGMCFQWKCLVARHKH